MIAISIVLLSIAINEQKTKTNLGGFFSIWRYGLGDAKTWAIAFASFMRKLDQTTGFFVALLFANVFQVVVSGLYLLINNLLTVLLIAEEWNGFILGRQTLRLSFPQGIQRSSYFLSLPFAYGIPLIVSSGLLHWMISQSVFVIQTIGYSQPDVGKLAKAEFEKAPAMDASVVGFSSLGIVFSLSIGITLVIAVLGVGAFKRYRAKRLENGKEAYPMPLVSTCSAAISAACHKHKQDTDASFLPLTWGFVTDVPTDELSPGRFCFTTATDVRYPSFSEVYQDGTGKSFS